MPWYDVRCNSCNIVREIYKKITVPNPLCEICGNKMETMIAQTSFILKGENWARNSYNTPLVKKDEKSKTAIK